MTMISSYYAQVGVKLDKTSLRGVRTYLNSIEKQLKSFQSRLSRAGGKGGLNLLVGLRINPKSTTSIQRDLNALAKSVTLNISNISFSKTGLGRAMRGAAGASGAGLKLHATLSQQSLSAIRSQVRNALSGIVVPGVRAGRGPTVGGSGGGGPRSHTTQSPHGGRNFSPWHNPMMIGGGVGAFMRYGAYSLPFVAGAMGLNALSGNMGQLQRAQMQMNVATGSTAVGTENMQYLSNLGNRLGFTAASVAPFFGQMLAGAKGTSLESQLPEGFEGFMEYASVTGLSAEQKKGAARAISQMISKRQVMAEELRGQLA